MAWLIRWGLCHPAGSWTPGSAPLWMRWGRGRIRALGLVVKRARITVSNEGWWLLWAMDGGRAEVGPALSVPVATWNSSRNPILNSSACREPGFSSTGDWGASVASSCSLGASQGLRFLHPRLFCVWHCSLRRCKGGWKRPLH